MFRGSYLLKTQQLLGSIVLFVGRAVSGSGVSVALFLSKVLRKSVSLPFSPPYPYCYYTPNI